MPEALAAVEFDPEDSALDPGPSGETAPAAEAVFVVDDEGRIIGCSENAAGWWRANSAAELCGRALASLFAIETPYRSIRPQAEAWDFLRTSATAQPLPLRATAGATAFPATLSLVPMVLADGRQGFVARLVRTVSDGVDERGRETAEPTSTAGASILLSPVLVQARMAFVLVDLRGNQVACSPSLATLLGRPEEELPTTVDALKDWLHPDDSEALPLRAVRGEADARVPFSADVRAATGDEGWRWIQVEGVQVFNDIGRLERWEAVVVDVEDRHETEEEMARNEDRFIRLTSRGRAGFFEIDLGTDMAWFSPEFLHALGYRAGEIGETTDGFMGLLRPEDAETGVEAFFNSVLGETAGLASRYALRHKDGRWLPFEAFVVVDRDRSGGMARISGVQIVVTAPAGDDVRVRSSEAVGGGEAGWIARQELDAVAEAVVIVNTDGLIVHANKRAAQDAGESAEALFGERFREKYPLVERATANPALDVFDRAFGRGQPLELDHSYALERKGGLVDVVMTCKALTDRRGRPTGAVIVLRKPSEMPLSPSELLASNRMEAIGRLACGIAHDFNNLLTTVAGGIAIAREKREPTTLETAQKACDVAKHLARQLLTFARGESTGKKVGLLNDIVRDTARMAGAGSNTVIELELSQDLHPVKTDAAQFVQVFTNLFLNAMQVMPGGGRIWVRTINLALGRINSVSLPPGDYVRVDVQDNGPGIPEANLRRIFEPFFSTRPGGTGLGLAMVRSIVAQHDGAIEASSTLGSGTTFTIYLPRAYKEAVKETPRPLAVTYGSGRVLVMDDDEDLCMIAKGMLDMLGYEAETASDGSEAIAKFRKQLEIGRPYAAVILDLTMAGGLGGVEVLRELLGIKPDVKAIVSSGYATDENMDRYREMGFAGVLAKPYRSSDMGRVLKEVIGSPA